MRDATKGILVGLGLVLFIFAYSNDAFSEEVLTIAGSTTCQKRFLEPAANEFKNKAGITIEVNGIGTGKGLIALLDGNVKVSAASEDVEGAITSAKKVAAEASRDLQIPSNLVYHEIITDRIIPIVHKDNPVAELTWQQLRDISAGKITNWKEVGGQNLPVQVITSHTGSATKAVFQKLVMEGREYAFDAIVVDSTRKEILAISKNKAAIGAVSMGFLQMYQGDTKPIITKAISRPLGLITIGSPQIDVQKLIDFLRSTEAKKLFR